MSMTFYTTRANATKPIGAHGPVDEDTAIYCPWQRTLDPTREQEIEAGYFYGPNLSNANAFMVLRSLDIEPDYALTLDPVELRGRCVLARVVPPVDDSGFRAVMHGNVIDCGVLPGYFARQYEDIAEVCEQAIAWGSQVYVN